MAVNLDKFFLILESKVNNAIDSFQDDNLVIGSENYDKILNSIVNNLLVLKNKKDFNSINEHQNLNNFNNLTKLIGTKYERMDG
jgi:hypothetical protein